MRVCIDPGHGGKDSGAVGPTGLKESDVNLELSIRLKDYFSSVHNATTKLTRIDDVFVELGSRAQIANSFGADIFVSIHCNSNGKTAVGIETLYKSEKGKEIAIPIHNRLIAATGDVDRGLKQRTDLAVLNLTNMPAVLCEIGFISHPATEKKLRSYDYKNLIVSAIYLGLVGEETPTPPPPSTDLIVKVYVPKGVKIEVISEINNRY